MKKKTTRPTMEQQSIKRLTIEGNELRRLKAEQFAKHQEAIALKNRRIDYLELQRDGLIDIATMMAAELDKLGYDAAPIQAELKNLRGIIGHAEVL